MDLATSLNLGLCRPLNWSVDLTPPREWDKDPGRPFDQFMEAVREHVTQALRAGAIPPVQIGKGIHFQHLHALAEIKSDLRTLEELMEDTKPATDAVQFMQEMQDRLNGTYVAPTRPKKGVKLPKKVTNTGPPQDPFRRRGKK